MLHRESPAPGKYREIVVVEHADHFELLIFEDTLLRSDQLTSVGGMTGKACGFPPTRDAGCAAAGEEKRKSIADGWKLYSRWNASTTFGCPLCSMLQGHQSYLSPLSSPTSCGAFSTFGCGLSSPAWGRIRDARRPNRRRVSVLTRCRCSTAQSRAALTPG